MKGPKAELVLVDDPEDLEGVTPATEDNPLEITVVADDDPRIVTPTDEGGSRIRVSRELGTCDICGEEDIQTVIAYDPAVYEGRVCSGCILAGQASDHAVDSPIMRPMVFVAKALNGEEPYRTLLKAADEQRTNPKKGETIAEIAKARARAENRLRHRGLLKNESRAPLNRHEKRIAAKQARARNAKVAKVAKIKAVKDQRNEAAQLDAFNVFAGGFK